MTRRFCSSVRADDSATSKTASTREAVTFACWPPGPDDRDARTSISRSGISTPCPTSIPALSPLRLRHHPRELPTGDIEHLAVHEVGPRGAEEERAPGRLLGRARAAERYQHAGHAADLVRDA